MDGGSPPRMRGRPHPGRRRHRSRGLTPANAGKTPSISSRMDAHGAHPRECGEDGRPGGAPSVGRWLTPANAGKTDAYHERMRFEGAHPRECGEDFSSSSRFLSCEGSPPRMRRRRIAPVAPARRRGLTPANAGKTRPANGPVSRRTAHPRECGEDCVAWRRVSPFAGSPPRMRGRRGWRLGGSRRRGLTPANAGKTSSDTTTAPACSAHPRECGEDTSPPSFFGSHVGSPPRMRGRPGAPTL